MNKRIWTPEAVAEILNRAEEQSQASIAEGRTQRPFSIQTVTLDLSAAKLKTDPKKINMPFRSVFVAEATDVLVKVDLRPNSQDEHQSPVPLKLNSSWTVDRTIAEAYLSWDAQPGKSVTLVFFTDSEYKSGAQISVTGGGVSIIDGSTVTGPTRVVLSAATAGIIAPADTTRKTSTIQNKTGADLFIGGVGVTGSGMTEGITIPPGGIIYWRNVAALYGFSTAGGNVHRIDEV